MPPEIAAILKEQAHREGHGPDEYAAMLLQDKLTSEPQQPNETGHRPLESLSLDRSMKEKPLDDVMATLRAKYALPSIASTEVGVIEVAPGEFVLAD